MAVTVRGTDILFNDGTTQSTAASAGAAAPTAGNFARGALIRVATSGISYAAGGSVDNSIQGGGPGNSKNTLNSNIVVGGTYVRTYNGAGSAVGTRQYYSILVGGTVRVNIVGAAAWEATYLGDSARTTYYRIYKNGVAVGTERSTTSFTYTLWSEDIAVSAGDRFDLYVRVNTTSPLPMPPHFLQLSVGAINQLGAFVLVSEGA